MKEEDLSRIKRYPIVEYLERKGIKPVRKTPTYAMYRSPLRAETHPSFKVDTEKNLWIDYGEGRGGSIIDLCMRMEGCTLSEAIHRLGQNASDNGTYSFLFHFYFILSLTCFDFLFCPVIDMCVCSCAFRFCCSRTQLT